MEDPDALNSLEKEAPKKEEKKKPKSKNNIPLLSSPQQAEAVDLDLESPRFKQAMENLQFTAEDFKKKYHRKNNQSDFRTHPNDTKDVLEIRKKHYYSRMMDTINQVLVERRKISKNFRVMNLELGRVKMKQDNSPSKQEPMGLSMYKSQKKILSASPKGIIKRKVEIMVQGQEDQTYKNLEKELKKNAVEDEGPR